MHSAIGIPGITVVNSVKREVGIDTVGDVETNCGDGCGGGKGD
jgi:hypothetical protein